MWRSPLNVLHFRRVTLMDFSEEVKTALWDLIDEMSQNKLNYVVHPSKDFSRKKKWDFPTLMKFIISMESQSLKNELHKYFGYTTECPTNASFNQRRAQISPDAFKDLFFLLHHAITITLIFTKDCLLFRSFFSCSFFLFSGFARNHFMT